MNTNNKHYIELTCNLDSEYWGIKKGRKAVQIHEYFRNGETHIKGKWIDNNETFDLPAVFFLNL